MRRDIKRFLFILVAWAMGGSTAFAQVGAVGNGDWKNGSTWTTGTVPGSSDTVYVGSTYPSGSAPTATVTVSQDESAYQLFLGYGSGTSGTLDLTGGTLTTFYLELGYSGSVGTISDTGGSFTTSYAYLYNGSSLNFGANDSVNGGYLELNNGSTATTSATGNLTGSVYVSSGSTLNMGADLNLSGYLDVENTGSVVHMNGHNVSAYAIQLGWNSGEAVTLDRGTTPGSLTATYIEVGPNNTLNLIPADSTTNLYLSGATVTTAATGNVTGYVSVDNSSTLNLGANLNLTSSLDIYNGSTVNAHGFAITSNQLTVGYFGNSAASLINTGLVTTNYLYVGNGSSLTLHGGDVVNNSINLSNGSTLTVQQTNGIGLTLNGAFTGALTIDPSSMDLIFTLNSGPNWDFRWADPTGGNWIATLTAMIASGQMVIDAPLGYHLFDDGKYTYIEGNYVSSVPEPSSLALALIAGLGGAIGVRQRRRRAGR